MIRKLTLIPALLLALAVAGGSSALGAGSVDGAPLDFGRAAVGDTQTKTETLKNISGGDLTIGAVTATGGPFDAAPPGPNNTCTGATLGAGTECSVDVSYSPNGTGGDTGTLTIDEGGADTDTFSLSGTGVAHRFIFTNPPANPDFADTAVGDTSGSKEITVTNNTDYPDNPNVHLGGSDPGDFNESDNCNSSVQPDCTATVSFQPHSQGAKSANLLIDGDSFTFTGTGVEQVTVQPLSLDFGDQHAGTNSSPQPVSISNNSDHSIDLNLQLSGQADYNISGCGGLGGSNNLAGGDTCTIQVVFSPNAPGAQNGTLTVAGQAVALTGRGTANTINVAPGSLAFGNQPVSTSSATRTVTVTNTGSESLHIGAPTVGGNNPLQFSVSDNCQSASPLLPGDQCTMTVAFIPTTPGSMSATIQVNSDANSGLDTVSLTGTATPSAVAFVPAPVLFERPHHAGTFSTPKTVTLTNRTSGLLTISKVYLAGPNPKSFRITGGNCAGRALAADASCTETVRFAPNEVGVKTANLIVNDDGPNGQHLVQLNGTSTYPKDDARCPWRGRLRRDEDHLEAGRIVEPVRSHRHRPQPHPHSDRARRRDTASARCRRPARSRAQPLHIVRLPGVRPLSLAHPAGDAQPLPRRGAAPADRRDLHADGRGRDQRHDTNRLLAPARDALRLLLPPLPCERTGAAGGLGPRHLVHVQRPAAPAPRASRTRSSSTPIRAPTRRARRSGAPPSASVREAGSRALPRRRG